MEDFINDFQSKNKSLTQGSITMMYNNIRRLERLKGVPCDEWIGWWDFEDAEKLILLINAKYSYNTAIVTLHGLLCWLDYSKAPGSLLGRYRYYLNDYIEIRNVYAEDNRLSDEQRERSWLDYPDLKHKVLRLNEKFLTGEHAFTKYRNYLILALYTLAYPVRLGNYIGMKYVGDQLEDIDSLPRTHNYICKGRDGLYTFIFNKYKTAKSLGQVVYKPTDPILQRLIKKWYANYNKNHNLFLCNTQGKDMTQTNLTNAISSVTKKLLNKEMTLNIIRQSFITDFMKKEQTIKERKKVLRIIGQLYVPSQADLYVRI